MKFKLVEQTIDNTRAYVQEYMYDAMDELNNASLEEYIQWFKSELTYYDDDVERAVKDAYIEACDYGMIKGVEKTRLTSELKEYIESNTDIIDDTDELMRQCPRHLQHELKIVLSKLDESLTESVLEEAIRPDLKRFVEQHAELLDENNIEELYKQCPRELKIPLVRLLNAASLSDNIEPIKRATFLADFYDDDELINLVLSIGEHANDVFDAFDYIMNNWDEFFTDDMLNGELLTESGPRGQTDLRKFICELLNAVCKTTLVHTDFMIHHKDGDHDNNHPKNIVLLPIGIVNIGTTTLTATNHNNQIVTNPNTSIHKNITVNHSTGVIDINDHATYISIINRYSAIDVWRSLQKHQIICLNDKLLKRDLNKSLKNPTRRIR